MLNSEDNYDSAEYEVCLKSPDGKDKYVEALPTHVPLSYAYFRYLGFHIRHRASQKLVLRPGAATMTLTIQTSEQVAAAAADAICHEEVEETTTTSASTTGTTVTVGTGAGEAISTGTRMVNHASFKGLYFFQEIQLWEDKHVFTVTLEGSKLGRVKPFCQAVDVYASLTLFSPECAPLIASVNAYGPFKLELDRVLMDMTAAENNASVLPQLTTEAGQDAFCKASKSRLRKVDMKWILRTYFQRQAYLKYLATTRRRAPRKPSSWRKTQIPIRTATKKETSDYFKGKSRERKKAYLKKIRVCHHEALVANKTTSVFSAKELFHQLAAYAAI